MKVLTVSRFFPDYHPRKGQSTGFVEKIWKALYVNGECPDNVNDWINNYTAVIKDDLMRYNEVHKKLHTIRGGNRFKAGDMASLRVWTDKPYRSKQIEFAQVEIKQTIPIDIECNAGFRAMIDGNKFINRDMLARNDGLSLEDMIAWFAIHPKKQDQKFTGQIICWQPVNY